MGNDSAFDDDGDYVDLASGIHVGDRVALNVNSQISDGDKVAVTKDMSGAQS